MTKFQFKRFLTFLYSALIASLFCLLFQFVSIKTKINFKESFFLVGLVLVLIGIVILIARNPIRMNGLITKQKPSEDEYIDETKTFLLGFNSITVFLVGVFILIIDVFIK